MLIVILINFFSRKRKNIFFREFTWRVIGWSRQIDFCCLKISMTEVLRTNTLLFKWLLKVSEILLAMFVFHSLANAEALITANLIYLVKTLKIYCCLDLALFHPWNILQLCNKQYYFLKYTSPNKWRDFHVYSKVCQFNLWLKWMVFFVMSWTYEKGGFINWQFRFS